MAEQEKRESRLDWWDSWNPTTKFDTTSEGYLQGVASVTSIGVFSYLNADGTTRRELRLPEEVFSVDSMASLKGKPLTLNHPGEAVNADNIEKYQVGSVGDRIDNSSYEIFAGVTVQRRDGVDAVKAGKTALSCGYDCTLDWKSGVYQGSRYDAIQRNIRYNHLSIVDAARAGDQAKIRMDGFGTREVSHEDNKEKEEKSMSDKTKVVHVDSVDYDVPVQVAIAHEKLVADNRKLTTDAAEATTKLSTMSAERDSFKEKSEKLTKDMDELKKDSMTKDEAIKIVRARLDLEDFAKSLKVEVKADMTDRQIQEAVIKTVNPESKLDGQDDTYVAVRFNIIREDAGDEQREDAANRLVLGHGAEGKEDKGGRADGNQDANPREAYLKRLRNDHLDHGAAE